MSKSTLISKFNSAFKKPTFFKEWDHYVKNPEIPEEEIEDFYGGADFPEDEEVSEEDLMDKILKKMSYKGEALEGKKWNLAAKAWLKSKLDDFVKDFSKAKFKGGKLIVYRTLTTHGDNEELIESFKDPDFEAGLYWSWTPDPSAHWGGRGRTATLKGLVDISSINIMKTLVKNLHPVLGDEETEIELNPRSPIEALELYEGREKHWEGKKTIKATLITALKTVVGEEDYQGSHEAPGKDEGPMHDLTDYYPDDIYSYDAARLYGDSGGDAEDQESISVIQSAKNKPNTRIKIYRAVPHVQTRDERIAEIEKQLAYILKKGKIPPGTETDITNSSKYYGKISDELETLEKQPAEETTVKLKINHGDWVTINKKYAVDHGHAALNGKFKILTKTVKAKELYTDANSIHEWGYNP